ncbi:iron uptake porin, partial [Synechococcus sp. CS-1329]|uniref:iron uptake porin n=1 Tax=Synechococcus sp. CS-1329 TaxID=2847975 RepID=UPI0021E2832A
MTHPLLRLVAPASLALLFPVAPPEAMAAELNLDGINRYAQNSVNTSWDQVTSITQFSDVQPTEWAYQALSNLIERYGCVAGYPDGTFRGRQPLSRWEAAALLNACLDRITEVTDE